jgi:hypothetical protein
VTKGLRVLPWLQLAASRDARSVARFFDCQGCMKSSTERERQHMGCGFLPRIENPRSVWDGQQLGRMPQRDELDDQRRMLDPVCAGYVCGLPEVLEASTAHYFHKHGGMSQAGIEPTPELRTSVIELDNEFGRALSWSQKNPVPE